MPGPYEYPGVYIEELPSGSRPIQGVATSVAAFLGTTQTCPDKSGKLLNGQPADGTPAIGRPFLVTSWEQYANLFGGFVNGAILPLSVYGFFDNGGGRCYVASMEIADGAQQQQEVIESRALPIPSRAADGAPAFELKSKVSEPVTVTVTDSGTAGDDMFKMSIRSASGVKEEYDPLTVSKSKDNAKNVLEWLAESKLVDVTSAKTSAPVAERRPAITANPVELPVPTVTMAVVQLKPETTSIIKGKLSERTGIAGLEALEDITMVCMPDIMEWHRTGRISLADAKGFQDALITHCKNKKDRLAILDAPYGLNVDQMREWRLGGGPNFKDTESGNYNSEKGWAALYYPWIVVQNRTGKGQLAIPPSGHIAGLYARVDSERGVHKAPANEVLRGAVGLELQINNQEQATLNPIAVNCIRAFPNRGVLVWGARTLVEQSSEWRYINVRRLFNYIEESIYEGIQWAVFEPNDMDLWERVKRSITSFLMGVWRSGALFGATPQEAFYVKCDAELNPADVRDRGELIVEVGLAPVKPAEFVIVRFRQIPGGGEVNE